MTRRAVLEQLATASDAERGETTTKAALEATRETDEQTIESHLDELEACELVRTYSDGRIKITITGEELLALDIDELVIIDSK